MKQILRILFLLIICINVSAQRYLDLKTVSSSLKKSYQKSLILYQSNQFAKAQKSIEKILKKEPRFIEANLILASIHFDEKNYDEAEKYFEKVLVLNHEYSPKVYYTLAITNYNNRHYNLASKNINEFLIREKSNEELLSRARTKRITYQFADSATQHPVTFHPTAVQGINSDYSEYLPSLTADGRTMVFTRKILNDNEDLFISYKSDDGQWSEPESITEINTFLNEGAPAISPDGNTLVFASCDRRESFGGCDLYISHKVNNKWTTSSNLSDKVNTTAYESQPCFADNGNILLFCSNRVGGYGGKDIWMTVKNKSNGWIKPFNLGSEINTILNEECPFMHQDGKTLYFSSDGHPGMGGKDIFYSRLIKNYIWSPCMNIGYPLNSPLDESSFVAY
ncbi:MAG: tetratricopeptide repeat protein, partial [Saprospiraceae bacterium]